MARPITDDGAPAPTQAERTATTSAKASSASRTGPPGQRLEQPLRLLRPLDDVGARLVHGGVGPQQRERLGVGGGVGREVVLLGIEELAQARVLGLGGGTREEHRQGRHALLEVGAGVLPDSSESEAMSRMSSESWKAVPTSSPYSVSAATTSGSAPENSAP